MIPSSLRWSSAHLIPWWVRPEKESDCKVTDYSTHVQRIKTRIDGKVKKHVVTFDEEKGEITFVEGGHVAAILKNPYCCEIYDDITQEEPAGWSTDSQVDHHRQGHAAI